MIQKKGTYFDFTVQDVGSGGGLDAATVRIIESNTGTQINYDEDYIEITWVDGLPSVIEKYEDNTKTRKLWTITPTFVDGYPTTIVTVNEDNAITETTTVVFADGVPTTITKS